MDRPSLSQGRDPHEGARELAVAVIGAAAAGVEMVYRFAAEAQHYCGVKFMVFDGKSEPAGGAAHGENCRSLFVNMRPELHDFEGFIPFRDACALMGWDTDRLPIRWLLGRYIHMAFDFARTRLELHGAKVELITAEVVSLLPDGDQYSVLTSDGQSRRFQFVVLATGNNPPTVPAGLIM